MTGGIGYFLDEDDSFAPKVNPEIVKIQRLVSEAGKQQLQEMIKAHVEKTGSSKGREILDNWDSYITKFWQVVPPSEVDNAVALVEEKKPLTSV
jgi:glutamate synthase (ferredoxin)